MPRASTRGKGGGENHYHQDKTPRRIPHCPTFRRGDGVVRGLACLLVLLLLLPACGGKDESEEILKVIREGASLAEKHDIAGMMKLTTEDFRALPGEVEPREVKRYLLYAFTRYKDFKVIYPEPSPEVNPGDTETALRIHFLIVQKDQSLPDLSELYKDPEAWIEQLGDKADLYRLHLEFTKASGQWRVRRARLEGFTGTGFGRG